MTEKTGQYFSCVFHNIFRFDMSFLSKFFQLSLWKTQEFSLLGGSLADLKSYAISKYWKFIDSTKYYQQSLYNLAQSTECEKKRIKSLFIDYFGFEHPYYKIFFFISLKTIEILSWITSHQVRVVLPKKLLPVSDHCHLLLPMVIFYQLILFIPD